VNLHVSTVLCLEEHNRSPVVRLVLNEAARRALGRCSDIVARIHCDIECITSNDLVKMRRILHARVHKRIRSLNYELRARESQHILGSSILRERRSCKKSGPLHLDKRSSRYLVGLLVVEVRRETAVSGRDATPKPTATMYHSCAL
jgi:hypothetical protein